MNLVNTETEKTVRGVGLLHKAFQVLELFTEDRASWTQAEIGRATDLTRSTVSRLVRYLCETGYLAFHQNSGRYTLGYSAIELGRRAQIQFDLTDLAEDILVELGQQTNETVILTRYDPANLRVVCCDQIASQKGGLRVFENVGATFPLYLGASSKPVLAHLPETVAEKVLSGPMPSINPGFQQNKQQLQKDLQSIRETGYATSREETYPGVIGIGAAILGRNGFPIGSIAIAVPMQRMSADTFSEYGQLVSEAVTKVSGRLGRSGDVEDSAS
jgi:DNA-binding IclR family transcriptional regulator